MPKAARARLPQTKSIQLKISIPTVGYEIYPKAYYGVRERDRHVCTPRVRERGSTPNTIDWEQPLIPKLSAAVICISVRFCRKLSIFFNIKLVFVWFLTITFIDFKVTNKCSFFIIKYIEILMYIYRVQKAKNLKL